ncbi:MAG: efflux RND transporter periplasmic adaptor subunit [Bacteroidales bacterium]|jgi:HlyD family secretion protein|nr:efflux RND transporter periplasmic adaptor subunit [Bacteroidales bacterium]
MDRVIEKKYKWLTKKTIWIAVIALVIVVALFNIVFGDKSSKLNIETDKITIETITEDDFKDYIAVIGTVEPLKTIYLDAIEGGRVEEIIIDEGNMVKKGDVILRLSNTNLILEISNNEAAVSRAVNEFQNTKINLQLQTINRKQNLIETERQLKMQKRQFDNNLELFKQGHISKEEFDRSSELYDATKQQYALLIDVLKTDSVFREVQVKSMEAQIRRMEDNLRVIQGRMENLKVKAPVDGELASLNPEVGEVINYGQRIGTVNILDDYKLRVDIDEHYIARVRKNLPSSFDFAGKDFALEIDKVYPEVINGRFAVDMIFTSEKPAQIRIGQTFRIKLELGESKRALLIPRGGFYQSTGGQWVYVVDPSGEFAVKRNIAIGRQNPKHYEVMDGLKPGEKVIVSSYDNFNNVDKLILKK